MSTTLQKQKKRSLTKLWIALAIAVVGSLSIFLNYLVFPGEPSVSKVLKFNGYIDLPRTGIFSALDYLEINQEHLYVTNITTGHLFDVMLNQVKNKIQTEHHQTVGDGSAHGIAIIPSKNIGYVTKGGLNKIDIFSLKTLELVKRIPASRGPDAILYDQFNDVIYVANAEGNSATVIDVDKQEVIGTIKLPGQPEYAVIDTKDKLVYQNLADINSVASIDLKTQTVTAVWKINSCDEPTGMAIDSFNRRLFVVCSGSSNLAIINLDTHQVIDSIKLGKLSDSTVFDNTLHRIYVASGSGQLTVIQQKNSEEYEVIDKITTHLGAHTLTLDPSTHKVYVAYAGFVSSPRIAVFSAASE